MKPETGVEYNSVQYQIVVVIPALAHARTDERVIITYISSPCEISLALAHHPW